MNERFGRVVDRGRIVINSLRHLWAEEHGQDVAEYAVMLAVILVIVIGTVRLIGGNLHGQPRCVWQRASLGSFCRSSPVPGYLRARLPARNDRS
jgi:Flp pilus assembly pilin Flp